MKKTILSLATLLLAVPTFGQKKPMKEYVDDLMQRMTLQEKIGQLNLMVAGNITTGSAKVPTR